MGEVVIAWAVDLAQGEMRQYLVEDAPVLVCNVGGNLHAVDGICPHRGAQLSQGRLTGTTVTCPWHEWSFDVTNGEGLTNPVSCLKQHAICVREGKLVVSTP